MIGNGQEKVRILSKIASDKWKKIKTDKKKHPNEDRELDFWKLVSEIADCQHKLMFPEYKYNPKQKQKRKRKSRKQINHAVSNAIVPQPLLLQSLENAYLNSNTYDEGYIDNVDTNNATTTQFVPIYDYGLFSLFDDLQTTDFCAQTSTLIDDSYSYYSQQL